MIGILDSGIGGLRVVRKIIDRFPDRDLLYLGDTARKPYGDKSAAAITRYAFQSVETLLKEGVKAVIIVSHTIACVAGRQVRETYNVPVMDVVAPVVSRAIQASRNSSFGVIGSRAVADSSCYTEAILRAAPDARVYSVACPLLAPLVEEGWLKKPETARIVKKYVSPLKTRQVDTFILGCNHYILLKPIIQRKIGKKKIIIDACDAIPTALNAFLEKNGAAAQPAVETGKHQFLVSDLDENLLSTARRIFGKNIRLNVVTKT